MRRKTHEQVLQRRAAVAKLGVKTQPELDAIVDRYITLAYRAEAKRDRCEWEGAEYWRWHDISIKWHTKAEELLP